MTTHASVVDSARRNRGLMQMLGLRVRHRARYQRSDPPSNSDS
ncbi:MAG: hypothetical protein QOF88_2225 [Mycobacterium sp.]|jgi:hypothetical protein|nr:hypothetical protein [Mycobacterium sp.]MDT5287336.1 hypothetical protein [Mycobacterium sp.]